MRSLAFFLAVFGVLILALYLVVDKDPAARQSKNLSEQSAQSSTAESVADARNTIDLPVFDPQRGRPLYRLRGELPPNVFQFENINNLDRFVLLRGELEIPVYEDLAQTIPGANKQSLSKVVLSFQKAEYTRLDKDDATKDEKIRLTEGGKGRADDGSKLSFEDLEVSIQRLPDRTVYTIRTARPVELENGFLRMASPSGLEGIIKSDTDLERIAISPPVRTYISGRSAKLFSLEGRGSNVASALEGNAGSIAITCAGPLVLDRTTKPATLEFRKDVKIFPLEEADEDDAPVPGDTWFHCQKLVLTIEESDDGPPRLADAVASWENGRVKASYEGILADGELLRWKNLGNDSTRSIDLKSETWLTGRPRFQGEKLDLSAETALLILDERRIRLEKAIEGVFIDLDEAQADDGAKPQAEEKKTATPERWHFVADRADLQFLDDQPSPRQGGDAPASDAPTTSEKAGSDGAASKSGVAAPSQRKKADSSRRKGRKREEPLDKIASLTASAENDGGLVLQSLDADRPAMRLEGKHLAYDGASRVFVLSGGENSAPRFAHGGSDGSAGEMTLDLKDRVLKLRRNVEAFVERSDIDALKNAVEPPASTPESPANPKNDAGATDTTDDTTANTKAKKPPEELGDLLGRGLRITGDEVDIALDEKRKIVRAAAASAGREPVSLQPVPDDAESASGFRLLGPKLNWDHLQQVAVLEPLDPPPSSDGKADAGPAIASTRPALEFREGILHAGRIEFDAKKWLAKLGGGIEMLNHDALQARSGISPRPADPRVQSGAGGGLKPLQLSAAQAQVEFHPYFKRVGPASDACSPEFQTIRRIDAWSDETQRVTILSPAYSASAGEASWDAAQEALKLSGRGRQEFHFMEDGTPNTLTAEEVVYRRREGVIHCRGSVSGHLFLKESSPPPDGVKPGAAAPPLGNPGAEGLAKVRWDYSSESLDVMVTEPADCKGKLSLRSLEAHDKVALHCASEGIRLDGDDLECIAERRELRVHSRSGRYQTLSQAVKSKPPAKEETLINKIDAREIRAWYTQDALAPDAPKRHQVVVRFSEDVTAAFYAPGKYRLVPRGADAQQTEEWKLRADYLLLRILKDQRSETRVQHAVAGGEVIVTSADMKAMAREAVFDEERRQLTLKGTEKHKVQLSIAGKTISDVSIVLEQDGPRFRLKTR
jgi:hypothetical protein